MFVGRYHKGTIDRFLERKIVLLSGPRQAGKTTISKNIFSNLEYLNYDSPADRLRIAKRNWRRDSDLLVLDELHKMKTWKRWLKGLYDTGDLGKRVLVTGSARLETFRKSGDSLAGRHYLVRLHPFDLKEAKAAFSGESSASLLARLLVCSGFPEPFLRNDPTEYAVWARGHAEVIIRQDLRDIEAVRELQQVELLRELLRECVGSTVSYSSLARDLGSSDHAVRRWLSLLEELYVVFAVRPYYVSKVRMIRKAPKFYFFDTATVTNGEGAALENLVACALLKEAHFRADTAGEKWSLCFVRVDENKEVDFLVLRAGKPHTLIEVKAGDESPAPALRYFHERLGTQRALQLVRGLERPFSTPQKIEVLNLENWLEGVSFA